MTTEQICKCGRTRFSEFDDAEFICDDCEKKISKEADKTKMKTFTKILKVEIKAYNDADAEEQLDDMMGETWFDNWCSIDEEDLRELIKQEKYI